MDRPSLSSRALVSAPVVALAVMLSLFARAPDCHAAEDRKALLQAGNQQRKAGDELGALSLFLRAHAIAATPDSFAYIGMTEYALNRFIDAEIHLNEALRNAQDPWIRKNHVGLEEYLSSTKAMLGWVEVVGTPAGAEVEVDGRPVGRLPLPGPVRVPAGQVNVRMDAPGYRVERRDVEVLADQTLRLNLDLARQGSPAAARKGGGGGRQRNPSSSIENEIVGAPSNGVASGRSPYWTAGWLTAGASTVLLGVGIWTAISKDNNVKAFNDYKKGTSQACTEQLPDNNGKTCTAFRDAYTKYKYLSWGAFAGAAVSAAVSIILFSASPTGDVAMAAPGAAVARAPTLSCTPSLLELGGSCALRF